MRQQQIGKFEFVTLPFATKIKGEIQVPKSSGLNWGQRPGREQNQAYLSVPAYILRSNFFPLPGVAFEVECDDGEKFQCVRAQANGKAIHTPSNNSLFGIYFRRRLGVIPGYTVTVGHLSKYGRSSVDVYKLDETKFFLDFASSK
jgi:hypothetical protein